MKQYSLYFSEPYSVASELCLIFKLVDSMAAVSGHQHEFHDTSISTSEDFNQFQTRFHEVWSNVSLSWCTDIVIVVITCAFKDFDILADILQVLTEVKAPQANTKKTF